MSAIAAMEQTVNNAVNNPEQAKLIVQDYVQVEHEIHASEKSKVMWYQRRAGMRLVLAHLGVTEEQCKAVHTELFPRATKEKADGEPTENVTPAKKGKGKVAEK